MAKIERCRHAKGDEHREQDATVQVERKISFGIVPAVDEEHHVREDECGNHTTFTTALSTMAGRVRLVSLAH